MLKPTGFRKKPTAFTQNMSNVPMEIEFFGVSGSSFPAEDSEMGSNGSLNQSEQDAGNTLSNTEFGRFANTNYSLELRVLNEGDKILKTLTNIEV